MHPNFAVRKLFHHIPHPFGMLCFKQYIPNFLSCAADTSASVESGHVKTGVVTPEQLGTSHTSSGTDIGLKTHFDLRLPMSM